MFSFPNPVNEWAARCVAGMVMALTLSAIFTGQWIIIAVLLYGFCARVATGPTLSPIGQIATRLLVPIIGKNRPVAGPPKRFAQSIGLIITALSSVFLVLGLSNIAIGLLVILIFFASLESFFGFCFGCKLFKFLMYIKIIPEDVCEKCNNLEF